MYMYNRNLCNGLNCMFVVKPMESFQLYVSIQLGTFHRFHKKHTIASITLISMETKVKIQ